MLTLTELTAESILDTTAMSTVRGGLSMGDLGDSFSGLGIFNTPTIDLGKDVLLQHQGVAVNQAGNIGGLNLVISDQTQNGIAGQVAI